MLWLFTNTRNDCSACDGEYGSA